jgi:hypothetical protein
MPNSGSKNGYPHMQPFNIEGVIKNKSKRKAWFQHPPYHNNRVKKEEKKNAD